MGTYTTINPRKPLWRRVVNIVVALIILGAVAYGIVCLAGVILHATGALP